MHLHIRLEPDSGSLTIGHHPAGIPSLRRLAQVAFDCPEDKCRSWFAVPEVPQPQSETTRPCLQSEISDLRKWNSVLSQPVFIAIRHENRLQKFSS